MPTAVLHVLLPLILMAFIKDYYDSRHKNKFPLHYVLIAGIAGLIPDLDVAAFWILHFFGFAYESIHRTFLHSLFIPLIFLILYFIFAKIKKPIKKRKLKLSTIFLMLAFGSIIHLILDSIFQGFIMPFYPLSFFEIGLNLANYFSYPLDELFIPTLEAILLVLWLIWLQVKHKISDFI